MLNTLHSWFKSQRQLRRGLHALLALLALSSVVNGAFASEITVGKPAPDFALKTMQGKTVRLSELRGQVVMVNFWATWCGPCREEMPLLNQIYQSYHGVGFELLGVNIDDETANAQNMATTLGIKFPVLMDTSKSVSRDYAVSTMPTTLVIGRDGVVRYLHKGFEGGLESHYVDEVRQLLKE